MRLLGVLVIVAIGCAGCSVISVADAAVTVAATGVKVGAKVVEATVDVAAAGVKAATSDKKENDGERIEKGAAISGEVAAPTN